MAIGRAKKAHSGTGTMKWETHSLAWDSQIT